MNDAAEVRYAASIFRACLDRRLSRATGSALELLLAMQSRMREPLTITNVFSSSFGADGDRSEMWDLYAQRGRGFSFSIPTSHGSKWTRPQRFGELWQCQYGEGQLADLCVRVLATAEKQFDAILAERMNWSEESNINPDKIGFSAPEFANEYLNEIAPFAAAFKPAVWQDEQEWRWVFVTYPEDSPRHLNLDLSSNGQGLAIASVCAGPMSDPRSVEQVRAALDARGMVDCPIHRSALTNL